jgi:uncharacterized protein (DUF488 family)
VAGRRQASVLNVTYTVGHSTRSREQLLDILLPEHITVVADVRAFPGSRRHPQFGRENLRHWLPEAGIDYVHMPALGGRRRPQGDSINTGWHELAFRGYADYMATAEFAHGLQELEQLAHTHKTAIMCAEAVWWRCHRRLISDALTARGWKVEHLGAGARQTHELTKFATLGGDGVLRYPPEQLSLETTTKED